MTEWTDERLEELNQQVGLAAERPSIVRELLNARRVIEAARPVIDAPTDVNLSVLSQALQTYDLSREGDSE